MVACALITRADAERAGKTDSEEYREACEVRYVIDLPSIERRRAYLALVREKRGAGPADRLETLVRFEWERRRRVSEDAQPG